MNNKNLTIYTLLAAALVSIAIFTSYKGESPMLEKTVPKSEISDGLPQVVESIDLKREYSFAGEALPMKNFDVYERLDRELMVNSYWHSSTLLNIKRSARYFPTFKKILKEQGVPLDFMYLSVAESSLDNVTSPAGARGLWQFMKPTATSYGLEVNDEVDERYHLEKSTQAFCKYIKHLKGRFGSWTSAAAAYNMGETGFARETARQGSNSYYDLNLNSETMRYLFRIVALREIVSEPSKFGFYLEDKDYYEPLSGYKEVSVTEPISSLAEFAKKHKMSYRMLKIYNPWLRDSHLNRASESNSYVLLVKE